MDYQVYSLAGLPATSGDGHRFSRGIVVLVGLDGGKAVELGTGKLAGGILSASQEQ